VDNVDNSVEYYVYLKPNAVDKFKEFVERGI
jgi:hypothetical protein